MKHDLRPLLAAACASFLCLAIAGASWAADSAQVLAQQLNVPMASKKVAAVLWTRRSDRYTLQVVFPRPSAGIRITPIRNNTNVTLWLLKADGTAIPTHAEPFPNPTQGAITNELAYSVSIAAGEVAAAAALKIDDEYFIEALRPLN